MRERIETEQGYLHSAVCRKHQDSVGVEVRHLNQKDRASYLLEGRHALVQAEADHRMALDL